MMPYPRPHGDKLAALQTNPKLPDDDRPRLEQMIERYRQWRDALTAAPSGELEASSYVDQLSDYRLFLDMYLIYDSDHDFLYRQKGQLKIDNSVIEEFLPIFVSKMLPGIDSAFELGPSGCFAGLYFSAPPGEYGHAPGMNLRKKDQDFAVAKRVFLQSSFDPAMKEELESLETNLGYFCAECKTNLDKTMFQEATATAHDLKGAVAGAHYVLLCEWLDMTPISTVGTDIDEVLILRKAKRLSSNVRSRFASKAGREAARETYAGYLTANPFAVDVFERLLDHVKAIDETDDPGESTTLERGYF